MDNSADIADIVSDNTVFETTYGIVRILYEHIKANSHLITTVTSVLEYIARPEFTLEKMMYKRANYDEYIKEFASYRVNIDEANRRITFASSDIFNKLSGSLLGDAFSLNSVFVEPLISFIFTSNMKYMYPLPFYCLETINVLDGLFTEAAATLSLTTDYIPVHNEIFYEIVEENERYLFFSSVINLTTFLRNKPCISAPPLRQLYMFTTADYSYYKTPQYFFEKFRESRFLAYRPIQPYDLINLENTQIEPKNALHTYPSFTQLQILSAIKDHVPLKHILFGQCLSVEITSAKFRGWLNRGRLISTCAWRPIINQAGFEHTNKIMILCTLSDGAHLLQYEVSLNDAQKFLGKFYSVYLPPILALWPRYVAGRCTTTQIERIYQHVAYVHSLQTCIITNYTLWPSTTIDNIDAFKSYAQRTVDVETFQDIMTKSFNLTILKHKRIYEIDGLSLNKITFNTRIVMYTFSSDAGSVVFSLYDFLYKLLHDIRISKTKQYTLIESLLFIFDIIVK